MKLRPPAWQTFLAKLAPIDIKCGKKAGDMDINTTGFCSSGSRHMLDTHQLHISNASVSRLAFSERWDL